MIVIKFLSAPVMSLLGNSSDSSLKIGLRKDDLIPGT